MAITRVVCNIFALAPIPENMFLFLGGKYTPDFFEVLKLFLHFAFDDFNKIALIREVDKKNGLKLALHQRNAFSTIVFHSSQTFFEY